MLYMSPVSDFKVTNFDTHLIYLRLILDSRLIQKRTIYFNELLIVTFLF